MDAILFALNAVLPIVLLIAFGYFLKRIGLFSPEFLKVANRFCFRALIPLMLFMNVYKIGDLSHIDWGAAIFAVVGIIIAFLIGLLLVTFCTPDHRQKGVVLQCVFRSNFAIIGIPLAEMIAGESAVATASVLAAFTIPVFNVLAVIALTMFNKEEDISGKERLKNTLKSIVTNPLIIGVVAGIVVVAIRTLAQAIGFNYRISDIEFLYSALNSASSLTTPLALIILGGQFEFVSMKENKKQVIIATLTRNILIPGIFVTAACLLFGFKGAAVAAIVALFASPVAVSSAIMAQEMKADGALARALVLSTTICSTVTLVVIIFILKAQGIV